MQARFLLLFATILTAAATPAAASSRATPLPFVPLGAQTEAPRGYQEMCASHPEWCGSDPSFVPAADDIDSAMLMSPMQISFYTASSLSPFYPESAASQIFPKNLGAMLDIDPLLRPDPSLPSQPLAEEKGAGADNAHTGSDAIGGLRIFDRLLMGSDVALHMPDMEFYRSATAANVQHIHVQDALAQADAPSPPADPPHANQAATGGIELAVQATRRGRRDRSVAPDLAMLQMINRKVNGRVAQRRDADIFGQGELWRRSGTGRDAVGDCEDLAIEKRLQLVAEGFPAEKLAYAVVYDRRLGLHTILVARTDQGDMVLDSASPYISAWHKTGYSWISIQAMDDPRRWLSVNRSRTA